MEYNIYIKGYIPKSPNSTGRKHWGRTMDERLFWEAAIGTLAYQNDIPKAESKRDIIIHIMKPGKIKLRDEDNKNASVKHCLDAMTRIKLILDDDQESINLEVEETNGHKTYGTSITIRDASDTKE